MKVDSFIATFMKAEDVTTPKLLTVESVEKALIGDEEKEKLVIHFEGEDQGVALGRTTITQLVEIFQSKDTDDWIGMKVVLFNDRNVEFAGRKVGGIRFRAPKNGAGVHNTKAPVVTPEVTDDIPF